MYPIVYMIIDTYYKGVIGLSVSNLGVSPGWALKVPGRLPESWRLMMKNGSLFILMEILEGNDYP